MNTAEPLLGEIPARGFFVRFALEGSWSNTFEMRGPYACTHHGKRQGSPARGTGELPDPVVRTADASRPPAPDPEAAQALQVRRLQEESAAREKKLLAELAVKHEMLYRQLEESLAGKEKKLIEDLQAASGREQALLVRLGAARRQLFVVIFAAVLGVVAILNFRAKLQDVPQPVSPPSAGSGQVSTPQSANAPLPVPVAQALPTVLQAPAAALADTVAVGKTGNGGNFSRGSSSGK